MAKKVKSTEPEKVVINDFRILIQRVDRTLKDLTKRKQALTAAESIIRPNRKLLYDIYADTVTDDHFTAVWEQRSLAITNTTLSFQDKEGKEIESINKLVNTHYFEQLLNLILDSKLWGYSLIHANFNEGLVQLVPRANVYPQKRIVTRNPFDETGISYIDPPYSSLYAGIGQIDDIGLLYIVTALVILKNGNYSDWAQYNEMFGQPIRIGKYDPNMPGQREQMDESMANMGAKPWVTIPDGASMEIIESNRSGAVDTYDKFHDRAEQAISKLIVGQTMTTTNGSSRAQGEVHERVATRIAQSDRRFVLRYLNNEIRQMMIDQGFTDAANGEFNFVEEEETITKEKRLEMDIKIHTTVGKLKKAYFAKEYNVPFVDDSDEAEPSPEPSPEPQKEEEKKKEEEKEKPTRKQLKLLVELATRFTDFFGQAR